MNNSVRVTLLICLGVLIVCFAAIRLLPDGDTELPPWAITTISVLTLLERIVVFAAVVYALWKLAAFLWPR